MRKIMFFRQLIYTGGTEIGMLNLIKNLKGFDIYVGYGDDTSDKDLLNEFGKYAHVININDDIDVEFDILILCTTKFYQIDRLDYIKRKKDILWLHFLSKKPEFTPLVKKRFDKLDSIVSVSKTLTNVLCDMYPEYKNKIKTIYNVLDNDKIINNSKVDIDLNLSNTLNLVTVARVSHAKGFDRMLHLANILKESNIDFKWFIVGDNYYKDEYLEIRDKFKDLEDNFYWFGFLDNPHNIVSKCDYSILLSDTETWGLVITEAMILGIPCIASDFDTAYEQIKDGYNGIILSRDNLDSYKKRINDILDNKDKYKKALNGFKYDNSKIIKKWEDILNEEIFSYNS